MRYFRASVDYKIHTLKRRIRNPMRIRIASFFKRVCLTYWKINHVGYNVVEERLQTLRY